MSDATEFDFERTYRAEGYGGIAWRADRYEMETIGEWSFIGEPGEEEDEDAYVWDEEERATGRIIAHMVGDDRPFTFEPDELEPLDEGEYCSCCGQIGCAWGAALADEG